MIERVQSPRVSGSPVAALTQTSMGDAGAAAVAAMGEGGGREREASRMVREGERESEREREGSRVARKRIERSGFIAIGVIV